MLLGILGILMFLVSIVWLVLSLLKRKGVKKPLIAIVAGFLLFVVGVSIDSDAEESSTDEITSSVQSTKNDESAEVKENDSSAKVSKQEKKEKDTTEKTSEEYKEVKKESDTDKSKTENDAELDEINKEIATHIEQNKGWALGTIDENANPIDDGTPNSDYANWLYVNSIIYDGTDIEVQVTADFKSLSTDEKNSLASSAQGITTSYASLLDSKPHVYFYNGENAYGGSKVLSATDYKWY